MARPDPAIFETSPWRMIGDDDLAPAATVPTMLSPSERRFYYWLARDWAQGSGATVDLGCFAGGSTALLADGARVAGRVQALWAYDRFHANAASKEKFLYPAGIPRFPGEDIRELADILLEPWQPGITLVQGRIEAQRWSGGAIEILAVDAAKSAGVLDRIAEEFYPALIPGVSIVVQQDFLHWKTPWIAVQMDRMSDLFTPVAFVEPDTVAFLCMAPVTAATLSDRAVDRIDDAGMDAALGRMADRLSRWRLGKRLARLAAAVAANPGARAARDMTHPPE